MSYERTFRGEVFNKALRKRHRRLFIKIIGPFIDNISIISYINQQIKPYCRKDIIGNVFIYIFPVAVLYKLITVIPAGIVAIQCIHVCKLAIECIKYPLYIPPHIILFDFYKTAEDYILGGYKQRKNQNRHSPPNHQKNLTLPF